MLRAYFAFVPLDNAATFWRHSPHSFITPTAALTMFKETARERQRGDRYAQVSI
jgi:hypothetical protein